MITASVEFLSPLRLKLVDNVDDIITEKKVTVRFEFDQDDTAVYNDSMRFSIDSATIELKSWRGTLPPLSEYVPLFRKNKLVYMNSFDVIIALDFTNQDKGRKRTTLQESNLYLACLTLSKDGKNRSKNLVVSLAKPTVDIQVSGDQAARTILPEERKIIATVQSEERKIILPSLQEDTVFDQLFDYGRELIAKLHDFFESEAFMMLYLSLLCMLCFFLVMRIFSLGQALLYNAAWKKELIQIVSLTWVTFSFYFLTMFLATYLVLLLLAIFFLIVGISYLKDKYAKDSFLTKIRTVIGMILITLVLPLLVKAYLLKNILINN